MSPFPTEHSSGVPYGGLPDNDVQAQLSVNYVSAVATAARCSVDEPKADFQGIDVIVQSLQMGHDHAFPSIAVQLKCTQQSSLVRDGYISWQLKRTNYEQLTVSPVQVPRILVVMICPSDFTTWVDQDADRLTMSHAAYWVSLRGEPQLKVGQESKTVRVPMSQPFNVESLLGMMATIGKGETL